MTEVMTQIVAAGSSPGAIVIFGLGEDNMVYEWIPDKKDWQLHDAGSQSGRVSATVVDLNKKDW